MISIERLKIFDKSLEDSLRRVVQLELDFEDAYNIGMLLGIIGGARFSAKTMFYEQVKAHGGIIYPGTEHKYEFSDIGSKVKFEQNLDVFLSKDESFDIDIIEVTSDDVSDIDKTILLKLVTFKSAIDTITLQEASV